MEDRLEKVRKELLTFGAEVKTVNADLFDRSAPRFIYDKVKADNIQIDILVNNAGQGEWGKFTETDLEKNNSAEYNFSCRTHLLFP